MQQIIHNINNIFNIDNLIIGEYNELLNKNIIINKDINDKIKKICELTLSDSGIYYKYNFLIQFYNIFKELYENNIHKNYILDLSIIDNKTSKNNECIFLNKLLCFYFIIKIMSNERTGIESITSEINISEFINNKFTFNNSCPHFILYITQIQNIKNKFFQYNIATNNNIGLIYHNINSWIITIHNKKYKINNLKSLLICLCKNDTLLDHEYVSNLIYNILFQIIYSLCALSKYNINHNDLRSENILLQNGYTYNNNVDNYKITVDNQVFNFFVPNYGFKIKIIDYGMSYSDNIETLQNPLIKYCELLNSAGVYNIYSNIYDIHCIINEIYIKMHPVYGNSSICKFMEKIINTKYIGTNKNNIYINEYWRLGFPLTIKYLIEKTNIAILKNIKLTYDENNKLIITDELRENLIKHLLEISREKNLSKAIINNIIDPLDNNINMILSPTEAIKLFTNYQIEPLSSINIIDSYAIDL